MTQNNIAKKENLNTLKAYLQKALPTIQAVIPKHMTGERLLRIVAAAATRDPLLLECTPMSIINAVVQSAQLGLEPVGPLGHAYLVPFFNKKTGNREAQFIPGYRGMIELARRSGNLVNIEAHVVHAKDDFNFCFGLEPKLEHQPYMGKEDAGEAIAVYAIARFRDGGYQTDVMPISAIDAIRNRSQAGTRGPWVTDYEEMARKTVVKRLCKYLPLSVEMAQAIDADNAAESGESQIAALEINLPEDSAIDVSAEVVRTKSDTLAEKLGSPERPEAPQTTGDYDERQSRLLDLLGDAGLGLTSAEQDEYAKRHTGKAINDLTAPEANTLISIATTELQKRDGR